MEIHLFALWPLFKQDGTQMFMRVESRVYKLLGTTQKYKKYFATLQHILQLLKYKKKGPTGMDSNNAYMCKKEREGKV